MPMLPFEHQYQKVNSVITIIFFVYTIMQLIMWSASVDIPSVADNSVTAASFIITIFGYIYYSWASRSLSKTYIE